MRAARFTVTRRLAPSGNYAEYVNTVTTRLVPVYRRWVPDGECWRFDPKRTARIRLGVAETLAAPGDHSSKATTYIPARILGPDGTDYSDSRFNEVYLSATPGTERTVTAAVDWVDVVAGGTAGITCSDETAANHQYCYPVAEEGRVVVYIENPDATVLYPVLDMDVRDLHNMNQGRDLFLPNVLPMIPEKFAIRVDLHASWTLAFTCGATDNDVSIAATEFAFPIEVLPIRAFSEGKQEPGLGYNLRRKSESMMASAPR